MKNTMNISFPYSSQKEFEESQKNLIREVIEESLIRIEKKSEEENFLTRAQVAKKLHISLPTLHCLTKDGTLAGYRLKGRVLYKERDIIHSLKRIESIKQIIR